MLKEDHVKGAFGVGVVLTLGFLVFSSIDNPDSLIAQVIGNTDTEQQCISTLQKMYDVSEANAYQVRKADLNNDAMDDFIVRINDTSTCGSGGCIHELCLTEGNTIKNVQFGYAVHELTLSDTISNGMRDIEINADTNARLTWTGEKYIFVE